MLSELDAIIEKTTNIESIVMSMLLLLSPHTITGVC
jgi:hypothetical protein